MREEQIGSPNRTGSALSICVDILALLILISWLAAVAGLLPLPF